MRRIVRSFNASELDYTITGALAASSYGTPRTTMDIDVVVEVAGEKAKTVLVSALGKAKLRADRKKIDAALKSGYGIATFEDSLTPFTVDIILSKDKLEKKSGTILGLPTFYQSPEDLISAKLRMIKVTIAKERALKDMDDVKAILSFTKVDMQSVKRKAKRDSTLSILEAIVSGKISKT